VSGHNRTAVVENGPDSDSDISELPVSHSNAVGISSFWCQVAMPLTSWRWHYGRERRRRPWTLEAINSLPPPPPPCALPNPMHHHHLELMVWMYRGVRSSNRVLEELGQQVPQAPGTRTPRISPPGSPMNRSNVSVHATAATSRVEAGINGRGNHTLAYVSNLRAHRF